MSGVVQKSKGLKRKKLICTNGTFFSTKAEAKDYINKLRNKGVRGSASLEAYRCTKCSSKKEEVIHVGHRRLK